MGRSARTARKLDSRAWKSIKPTVTIARSAGFCMGVSLALGKLDRAILNPKASPIFTLGPIIHNPQVLQRYKDKGVQLAHSLDEIPAGSTVVIRAHGIPKDEENKLRARQATIIDATCPKVKRAQLAIEEQSKNGKTMLLFGEADHPEVRGLLSYSVKSFVFESIDTLKQQTLPPATYFLAAQTTQDRNEFYAIEAYLKKNVSSGLVALDTICDATKNRQEEVIELAQKTQCVIVVGGKSSGNTRRLAEIASTNDVAVFHVETVADLPLQEMKQYARIGLTAGASTPQDIVDEIRQQIENLS